MKATVDRDLCIGCGLCESGCPSVFSMIDGIAVAIAEAVPSEAEESCHQAAEDCPVNAISTSE